MRKVVLVAALVGALMAEGETVSEAQTALLKDVRVLDVGGGALPGGFVLFSTNAFPLATCRYDDGTTAVAAAGAFYGAGRAVFLNHPNALTSQDFRGDMVRFLQNAVAWEGRTTGRVGALRNGAIARTLRAAGVTNVVEVSDLGKLDGIDAIALTSVRKEDIPQILAFVEKGGGLIQASLGWGFLYFNKNACFAEDFTDNRLSGAMGVLMSDAGVRTGGFPAVREPLKEGVSALSALDFAEGAAADVEATRRQVAKTLSTLMNALGSGVAPTISARLDAICERPEAALIPSPEHPISYKTIPAMLATLKRKNAYLSDPERTWGADPAAVTYPGLAKAGAEKIVRTLAVDLSIPKWHSTGVYAVAGEAITVTLPKDVLAKGLKVRVGTTADDLSAKSEWKRAPLVTVELPLVKEKTTFASPFGGLVYIDVPFRLKGETTVEISGGIMAPWFKAGRDTNEKFIAECAATAAPWGEIETKDFVVTSQIEGLRKVTDPAWIADFWQKVMEADQDLAQWKVRTHHERICSDVQLTGGFLHDGYPLMSHINAEKYDWAINKDLLAAGDGWGVFHEIGHMHQNRDWTPEGTSEVTVNLFTMYAIETVAGANLRDARYPCGAREAEARVKNWVKRGKTFAGFKGDYFLALELYLRIKEAYGWDAYKRTFARYFEPTFKHPTSDAEKWNVFARTLSRTVDADMGKVFAAWSIPLDDFTRRFCAEFPPAKASLTQNIDN